MNRETLTGDTTLRQSILEEAPKNPLNLLQQWLDLAVNIDISEPKGFVLSTISDVGKLSSRVVLLKKICNDPAVSAQPMQLIPCISH